VWHTDQTLLEQLRINDIELESRKRLFGITEMDVAALLTVRPVVESRLDSVVGRFYDGQTSVSEIALLIGDADTLHRLRHAQRRYVQGLFSGQYDLEYVNSRLRIGLVHKRIGVEPNLYLSAVNSMTCLLLEELDEAVGDPTLMTAVHAAMRKLVLFDAALVFETYIRSLVTEIEHTKDRSDRYAQSLEEKVRERTRQLEDMTRTDPLTGLLSVRYLREVLEAALHRASRRDEIVSLVYLDVVDFKHVNDTEGHQRGDEVLAAIGAAMRSVSRVEDLCFRYGGDEFVVILPHCRAQDARTIYLDRLHEELRRSGETVTLSVGCVETGPPEYLGALELMARADQLMYQHKRSGDTSSGSLVPHQVAAGEPVTDGA
jgi:diguanylate cyclase